jgi:hypothetical protein
MEQMEQILPENSQNTRLKGTFPELPFHLFHLFHHHSRPHRPSTENGVNLTPLSGSHATARHVGGMFSVSEKTMRNTAEFAEAVITVPSVPTAPTTRAPNRPSTENADKLSAFSGRSATARQLGDLRRAQPTVYRKGCKFCTLFRASCDRASTGRLAASENAVNLTAFYSGNRSAPTLRAIPRKSGKFFHFFAPL